MAKKNWGFTVSDTMLIPAAVQRYIYNYIYIINIQIPYSLKTIFISLILSFCLTSEVVS